MALLSFTATPRKLLLLFFLSQLLIYFDRGLISAVLPALADTFAINNSEMGLIGSCFIFGYMLACPMFAFFSRSYSVYKLMSIGLFLWVVAVALCGVTNNFITLLGARILTGVGEASFAGLAPACIDDVSPKNRRTLWLSVFFAGLPIGGAIGYIVGGQLVNIKTNFPLLQGIDWHTGFLLEAALMIPIIMVVFAWPPIAKADLLSPANVDLARRVSFQRRKSYGSLANQSNNLPSPSPIAERRDSAPPHISTTMSPVHTLQPIITPMSSTFTLHSPASIHHQSSYHVQPSTFHLAQAHHQSASELSRT